MIRLKIDHIEIEVPHGTTVLQAARQLGIDIPTMCHVDGFENKASCLVCLVKDMKSGKLHPSCAMQAGQDMEIVTTDPEVVSARQQALELLLSDHVGDCEAPCRTACPVFTDIAKINRLIAERKFHEAIRVVKKEMAFPLILGFECEAPCEKVCRRRELDTAISICQLIKFVALEDHQSETPYFPEKLRSTAKKVAIVGTGPSGLSCAFHLLQKGYGVVLYDKNEMAGGSLARPQETPKLPPEYLKAELDTLAQYGALFRLGITVDAEMYDVQLSREFDAVVIATGASDVGFTTEMGFHYTGPGTIAKPDTFETGVPGLFACGSLLKPQKMLVKAMAQGKAAAFSVDRYLKGLPAEKLRPMFNSKFGKLEASEKPEYLKEASEGDRIWPLAGEHRGYSADEVVAEASRCMHCDCRKVDNCKLRIFSDQYQADRKKYLFGKRKLLRKYDQHEQLIYEPEKCIRCSLCVEICRHNKELQGLTEVGRGFDVHINVPFNDSIKNALNRSAEACVRACPTAALAFKDTDKNNEGA